MSHKIASLKDYYDATVRNGFYLPPFKSSCVTLQYIDKVRRKETWCPRFEDARIGPCPQPPSKEAIVQELERAAARNRFPPLGFTPRNAPSKHWLLHALRSIEFYHVFFSKSYLPPPKVGRRPAQNAELANDDGFFDGLPPKRKAKGSQRTLNKLLQLQLKR